jgi:hypothetical protein
VRLERAFASEACAFVIAAWFLATFAATFAICAFCLLSLICDA